MTSLSVCATQGAHGQTGAVGLPGIRGNTVRIHIMLHPVGIMSLVNHIKWCIFDKTTVIQCLCFTLSLCQGMRGEEGEKGEAGARGSMVRYRICAHGDELEFTNLCSTVY